MKLTLECGVSAPLWIAAKPLSLDRLTYLADKKAAPPQSKAVLTHRTPKISGLSA